MTSALTIGFAGLPVPQRFNMAGYALRHAALRRDHPALIVVDHPTREEPAEVWSYGALQRAVLSTAGGLQSLGLEPGARLLVRLENSSAYAIVFFGAIAAGLVPVPVSSQLTASEAGFLARDCEAAAVLLDPALGIDGIWPGTRVYEADILSAVMSHEPLGGFHPTSCDDPAFLVYTSGTTARPKGVLHAQRSAWGRRPMYDGWYGLRPDDRMLHAGAFNWTYTLGTGLTDPWANGATAIVYTGARDAAAWPSLIRRFGATLFAAVPTLYRQILKYAGDEAGDLGRLRHGLVSGETMPWPLWEAWRDMTGLPLYEALGMSELSTFISSSRANPPRQGAIGRPQPGRIVAILPVQGGEIPLSPGEEGLLAVHRSDPGLMLGYWGRPEEEREVMRGDWFAGGDLAVQDPDGYIFHRGRANDLMNAMGYRVSPLEVEQILSEHPDIAEVAVTETETSAGVSVIAAFIVPRTVRQVDLASVQRFAGERLAAYKVPRHYEVVRSLPRTANGKVQRAALRHRSDQ